VLVQTCFAQRAEQVFSQPFHPDEIRTRVAGPHAGIDQTQRCLSRRSPTNK
jgi:hypothetical protein